MNRVVAKMMIIVLSTLTLLTAPLLNKPRPLMSQSPANDLFTFVDSGQRISLQSGSSITMGDLDGDNDVDIYEANTDGADRILLNDGQGYFVDSGSTIEVSEGFVYDIELADVDGDND